MSLTKTGNDGKVEQQIDHILTQTNAHCTRMQVSDNA